MCGISGLRKKNKHVSTEEIAALNSCVSHRGPNGSGTWLSKDLKIGLGHQRLSVLDISDAASQPMSLDERYQIVFNGEIYNFIEVRNDLQALGHSFRTSSDTEVILVAYKEWGLKMLERFNGMWAFALYDSEEEALILSRDRFGVKPLYYYKAEDIFVFSSEVQAIHSLLGAKHPLNKVVLKSIAAGSIFHHGTNQTYLSEVFALPAGSNLTFNKQGLVVEKWYHLKKKSVPKTFEEQAGTLKDLLFDACKIRLRSDVPVGTCLSGGVDSSSIAAIIREQESSSNIKAPTYSHKSFCASFPRTPIDESAKANDVATTLGLKLDVIHINAPSVEELMEAIQSFDGPSHSLAFYPIWKLYKHIRTSDITVTLDGQGPDEMMGGYRPLSEALFAALQLFRPGWFIDVYKTYAAQGETSQFSARKESRRTLGLFLIWELRRSVKDVFAALRISRFKSHRNYRPKFLNNRLDKALYDQFFSDPLPGILQQYDRCSMAHGIECRMPFMDFRVVEFVFSLPPYSKVGNGYTKRVLREAMKDIVQDDVRLNKEKLGFNAPIVDWFRNDLRNFMMQQMDSSDFINSPYFDGKLIKSKFEAFLKEPSPQWKEAWKFWGPVHVTLWAREINK